MVQGWRCRPKTLPRLTRVMLCLFHQGVSMTTLSRRGKSAPASPIRKLEPFARQASARGLRIYHQIGRASWRERV